MCWLRLKGREERENWRCVEAQVRCECWRGRVRWMWESRGERHEDDPGEV